MKTNYFSSNSNASVGSLSGDKVEPGLGANQPLTTKDVVADKAEPNLVGLNKSQALVTKGKKGKRGESFKLFTMASMPKSYILGRSMDNRPYDFFFTQFDSAYLATSTTLQTFKSSAFLLNNLNPAGNLTAIFDQYRIVEVETFLIARTTASASNTSNPGIVVSVVDYDNVTNLSNVQAGLNYQNCLFGDAITSHYRRFKPHAAVAAYSGGAFTAFANMDSQWVDSAYPSVEHYGLKYGATVTDVIYTFDHMIRMHVQFRNVF